MAIKFIHTGDWHIAKPYGRLDAEKAALLRDARARIPDRLAALARREQALLVLVAGDVFDSPGLPDEPLRRLAARLEQLADIQWHFLPGNHDAATPNGIWQRFARFAPFDHVTIHHEAGIYALGEGVDLLTAPLRARAIAHDPTLWMNDRPSAKDTIRIGLAHGAIQGFGSEGDASVLISTRRAEEARLDYLALGDWHGAKAVAPRTWYAGTPEPDQFPDNEPGYCLSVAIEAAGAEPIVQRHWLGHYRWQREVLAGDVIGDLEHLEKQVTQHPDAAANLLLQVRCQGRLSVAREMELRTRIERLADLVFHLDANYRDLEVDSDADPQDLFQDPLLAAVATRLAQSAATAGEQDATISHQALLLLSRLAAEQEGRR